MKKMLMLVVMFGMFGWIECAWCQTQEKSASDMQAEIAALQVKLVDAQAKEGKFTSQFAGFGKELGVAFNGFVEAMDGGMKVTTERVNDFAKTDVGKFAMVGIGWKIFATDILGMVKSTVRTVLGLVFLGIFCFVLKRASKCFSGGG